VRFLRSTRGIAVCAVIVLGLLFLVRPGANRLKARIVSSISLALGRPVDVASVRVRLLPQPGFELDNFVVHDDPAFGVEPMLRAQQVTASLRLTSLMRGRLEIARLDLTEPSLNLVHGPQGRWNIEALVERAEKNPTAPTSKPKSEKRPGFPYIDASSGRVNFKFGPEKKPYALADADFSLWQESENTWGMRLKAQPMRTDLNLTDTGTFQASGTWQRAARLSETPMQFAVQWKDAQLGQLTKLAYGDDKGWRGTIRISATLAGTPESSIVSVEASADDFRRFDVLGGGDLRLAAQCGARYNSVDNALSEIACRAPVGEGIIAVRGRAAGPLARPAYDLAFAAQGVPIQSLVNFARHSKKGVPEDLVAAGQLDAEIRGQRTQPGDAGSWTGGGQTSGLRLTSASNDSELGLDTVPFSVSTDKPGTRNNRSKSLPSQPHLQIGPFHAALGRSTPAIVTGTVGRQGYDFEIHGDAQVQRLFEAAKLIGVPAPQPIADGPAKVDLQLAGDWPGALPVRATGRMQLHSVRARVPGLNAPLEIVSANLVLTPEQINVQTLVASAAGSSWQGSLTATRPCTLTLGCEAHFDLHASEIALDRLNQLLNPEAVKEPWYRILSSSFTSATPYLSKLNASGKLRADRVEVSKLEATNVTANVELKNDTLTMSDLQGDVLGGRHKGEWTADFTAKPPKYAGNGTFKSIALGKLAESMKDNWISGTATASYRAMTSGLTVAEMVAAATASVQVDASGALPHVVLTDGSPPLQMRRLTARLLLRDKEFDIQTAQLETPSEIFHLSGTASLARILNLKLTRASASGFNITGSLTEPHVSQVPTPETRAALKQ